MLQRPKSSACHLLTLSLASVLLLLLVFLGCGGQVDSVLPGIHFFTYWSLLVFVFKHRMWETLTQSDSIHSSIDPTQQKTAFRDPTLLDPFKLHNNVNLWTCFIFQQTSMYHKLFPCLFTAGNSLYSTDTSWQVLPVSTALLWTAFSTYRKWKILWPNLTLLSNPTRPDLCLWTAILHLRKCVYKLSKCSVSLQLVLA